MAHKKTKDIEEVIKLRIVERASVRWQNNRQFLRIAVIGELGAKYGNAVFELFHDVLPATQIVIDELMTFENGHCFMVRGLWISDDGSLHLVSGPKTKVIILLFLCFFYLV